MTWALDRLTIANRYHWNLTIAGYSADRAFATEISLSTLFFIAICKKQFCSHPTNIFYENISYAVACSFTTTAVTYLPKVYLIDNDRSYDICNIFTR